MKQLAIERHYSNVLKALMTSPSRDVDIANNSLRSSSVIKHLSVAEAMTL